MTTWVTTSWALKGSNMALTFPLNLTWADIAKLDDAADAFGWDESMLEPDDPDTTLEATIAQYSEAFISSPKLSIYLGMIGYELTAVDDTARGHRVFTGISIRNEQALHTAHALFNQISFEYDDPDGPTVQVVRHGYPWASTPTWALFELGGDDDVDYCGGQPSCLTSLLVDLTITGDLS